MHSPDVVRIINAIRNSHPDCEFLYMEGRCYAFYLILRSIFPTAEAYYSRREGHVYVKIFSFYYDIRGVHLVTPDDLEILDHQQGDPPHRWGDRDARRLVLPNTVPEKVKKKRGIVKYISIAVVLLGAMVIGYEMY